MTITQAIAAADGLRPNGFTAADKTAWLGTLAALIQTEVWLLPPSEVTGYTGGTPDSTVLPWLPVAYEELWSLWLQARIDAANGEFDRYTTSYALFNSLYGAYRRWFCRVYDPANQQRLRKLGAVTGGDSSGTLGTLPGSSFLCGLLVEVEEAFAGGRALTLGTGADGDALLADNHVTLTTKGRTAKAVSLPAGSAGEALVYALTGSGDAGHVTVYGRLYQNMGGS